jgi:hypothetical protein
MGDAKVNNYNKLKEILFTFIVILYLIMSGWSLISTSCSSLVFPLPSKSPCIIPQACDHPRAGGQQCPPAMHLQWGEDLGTPLGLPGGLGPTPGIQYEVGDQEIFYHGDLPIGGDGRMPTRRVDVDVCVYVCVCVRVCELACVCLCDGGLGVDPLWRLN